MKINCQWVCSSSGRAIHPQLPAGVMTRIILPPARESNTTAARGLADTQADHDATRALQVP